MSSTTPPERKGGGPSRSQVTSLYIEDSPVKSKRGSVLKIVSSKQHDSREFRPTSSNYDSGSLRADDSSSVFAVFINDSILPMMDSSISLDTDAAVSADISQGNSLSSDAESSRETSSTVDTNKHEVSKDSKMTEAESQYFDANENVLDPPVLVLREFHLTKSNRTSTHTITTTGSSVRNSKRGESGTGSEGKNFKPTPNSFVRNLTPEIEYASARSQQVRSSPRIIQGKRSSERIRANRASESSNLRGSVSLSIQTVSTSKLVDEEDEHIIGSIVAVPSGSVLRLSSTDKISTKDSTNTPSLPKTSFTHLPLHRVVEDGEDGSHPAQRNLLLSSPTTENSFWYSPDNDVEPDIEEAMDLLKKEMRDSLSTPNFGGEPFRSVPQWIGLDEFTPPDNPSPLGGHTNGDLSGNESDEFVPQEYHLIRKVTDSPSIPPRIPSSSPELHQPRSPALINKFIFSTEPETPVEFKPPAHQPFMHQIEIDNLPIPTSLMKVPLLRTISGSSRWKPNPDIETDLRTFSVLDGKAMLGSHPSLSRSLHRKVSLGEHPIPEEPVPKNEEPSSTNPQPAGSNEATAAAAAVTATAAPQPVTQTVRPSGDNNNQAKLIEPRPSASPVRRNTTNVAKKLGSAMEIKDMQTDMEAQPMVPMVQTVDTQSIESFDSGNYTFREIYSIQRIALMLLLCIVCPPLFFMVGMGPKGGVDDYHLLKLVLNKEHRASLLEGFIWDVDVVWIRTGCLIMGVAELLVASACIGVGFGIGLRR